MKFIKIFVGFLVLFMFVGLSQVKASGTISVSEKGPMLASVGVADYKIVSQENNKIIISFNLLNQGDVQSGIRYGVKLIKEVNKSQFLADEKVYDESITLPSGANLKKEITYIAPSNLDGEYTILLTSRNESGLIFGMSSVGKVKLASSTKGIVISPETCKLSIPGEKNKYIKYNLIEGVDISATEPLQLHCSAVNTDSKAVVATPKFETHFRTLYGDIVPQTDVAITPISFNAGEKKDIAILLPKALKSQAYDLRVVLEYGNEKSNAIVAHYVIQGVSVTIQNISLDKDFYEKGDTAKMFFSWSQSADNFPGSRLGKASVIPEIYVNAKITNKYGINCIDPIKQLLPTDHNTLKNDISATIKRSCTNPKISISLADKDGNVLDQKEFNVETSTKEKKLIGINIIIAITILALVIALTLVYIKHKKGKNPPGSNNSVNIPVAMFILLFTLVSVGINFPLSKTDALMQALMAVNGGGGGGSSSGGTTVTGTGGTGTTPTGLAATLTVDKSSYDPGSTIKITTAMYYTGCTNVTRNTYASGHIEGKGYTGQTVELFNTIINGQVSNSQDSYITAPTTPGDYTLKMEIKGYYPNDYRAYASMGGELVTSKDFTEFKSGLQEYLYDHYSEYQDQGIDIGVLAYQIYWVSSVDDINMLFNANSIPVTTYNYGGGLAFTRSYDFSPIKVPGVTVKVNEQRPTTSVNYNGDAAVTWSSISASSCGCTCEDSSKNKIICGNTGLKTCGTGTGTDVASTPATIHGLTADTVFRVVCN